MARVSIDKQHLFTFIEGLNTEASPLTFPENSIKEGSNVDVELSGIARRRLGIDYELNWVEEASTTLATNLVSLNAISFHRWESVNNNGSLNYAVIQNGYDVYIYDLAADPLSGGYLNTFNVESLVISYGEFNPYAEIMDATNLNGRLFLVATNLEPMVLEFDEVTGELIVSTLVLKIRDFDGVDDGLDIDETPSTLTNLHNYNLMNQGWIDTKNSGVNQGAAGVGGNSGYFFVEQIRRDLR